MCEQCRQSCHSGWWADADQTSDPRDVFHHHHRGGLWAWGAAHHTSSRGRRNQPPRQLLSVQCPGPYQSVHKHLNWEYWLQVWNVAMKPCDWDVLHKPCQSHTSHLFSFKLLHRNKFRQQIFDTTHALTKLCLWVASHANTRNSSESVSHYSLCQNMYFVFIYCRLLRCGSSQCEQGVEMCALQGQRYDWG